MRYARRKFVFKIDRKVKGENHYGKCLKCKVWHKIYDLTFSRRSKGCCKNCSKILFVERHLEGLDVIDSNIKMAKKVNS